MVNKRHNSRLDTVSLEEEGNGDGMESGVEDKGDKNAKSQKCPM